jgi:hypothetical protein
MVLDAGVLAKLKRQTKQRRRRYVARTPKYTQVIKFTGIIFISSKKWNIKMLEKHI